MSGRLDGHHALVTGGGTGIGAAIAAALAADGAAVTIAGRRRAPLDEVCRTLARAQAIMADVTRELDCARLIESATATFGPIDIVVANAGAAESAPAARTDLALWQRMLDVNLTGAFLTVRAALASLARRDAPPSRARRVVFVASMAGLQGFAYVSAYCAAKHGVIGLMRALAIELARSGVTVNAVCPGYTETPMLESSLDAIVAVTGRSRDAARAALAGSNPGGHLVTPAEVAAVVRGLCGPDAAGITGQAIPLPEGGA
jgi:NAD(P)-dependent dehydrogenase (short-subunit alcohol dehydrogenase family)